MKKGEKPKGKGRRIGPLNDAAGIQRELHKVYRQARRGEIDTIEMARFVTAVREMRRALVAVDHEKRLVAVEEFLAKQAAEHGGPAHRGR